MNFLYPFFLWTLAGISIPVLIHFFGQKKKKKIPFSYIEFLRLAKVKSIKLQKLKEALILILRTLLIALLLLVLAEPVTKSLSFLKGKKYILIILDNSASLNAENGKIWEKTKSVLKKILDNISGNDKVALVFTDGNYLDFISKKDISEKISSLKPSYTTGNLNKSIIKGKELLREVEGNKIIFIISDMQKILWENVMEDIQEKRIKTYIIDTGKPNLENIGIKEIKKIEDDKYLVSIVNWSKKEKNGQILLNSDGKIYKKNFYILPSERKNIIFKIQADTKITGRVNIEDSLKDDNFYYYIEKRNKEINILIITSYYSETIPVINAIKALTLKEKINYKVVKKEEASEISFSGYDFIFIINAGRWSKNIVERINFYLKSGGNLILFIGNRDIPENFNNDWKVEKNKFLQPAKLTGKKEFRKPVSITYINRENKLFYGIEDKIQRYLKDIKFEKLFITKIENGNVLIETENGYPAGISLYREKSNIVLFPFSLSSEWTNFPFKSIFPVFIDKTIKNLRITYTTGYFVKEKKVIEFPDIFTEYKIISPDGKIKNFKREGNKIDFEPDIPGIWTLLVNSGRKIVKREIPVNINYIEGNLEKISEKEMKNKVNFPFNLVEAGKIESLLKSLFTGYHLKFIFITIAFILFLTEMYITDYIMKKND